MNDHEITEHIQAPLHEVERLMSEGWLLAPGWRNAGHHLRYSIPLFRPVPPENPDA